MPQQQLITSTFMAILVVAILLMLVIFRRLEDRRLRLARPVKPFDLSPDPPSYTDLTVQVGTAPPYRLSEDMTLQLQCGWGGGWRLYRRLGDSMTLLAEEYGDSPMRITVGHLVVLDTYPRFLQAA